MCTNLVCFFQLSHLKLETDPPSPPGSQNISPPSQQPPQTFSNSLQINSSTPYTPLPNESPTQPTSPGQLHSPNQTGNQLGVFQGQILAQNVAGPGQSGQGVYQGQGGIFSAMDSHRLRIATRGKSAEGSWDEDSAISQTSSTSGYRYV